MPPDKDGSEDFSFVPPREVPPAEWPLGKQIASYQKWLDAQGGTSGGTFNEGQPIEESFAGLCPDCEDADLPEKLYLEHFSPPLRDVDPDTVAPDDLSSTIEFYRQRFLEQGDFLSPCEHFSRRETLRWIRDILHTKHRVTGRGSTAVFQPNESCPECKRQVFRSLRKESGKSLLDYCEEELESLEQRLVDLGRHLEGRQGGLDWPPGVKRLKILSKTALQRLEDDITSGDVPVLEGNEATILNVLGGAEALSWVVEGMNQLYEDKPTEQVLETLRGGARMIRILDDCHEEPDQRPGRFYDDLCSILPDVEGMVDMLSGGQDTEVEHAPDFPDPSEETPEAWLSVFREELAQEFPSFSSLIRNGVTRERLYSAHRDWLRREHNREIANERAKRRIRDALGRSVQFDPGDPVSFLEGTVNPIDPEDVDPTRFDNPTITALLLDSDSTVPKEKLDLGREQSEGDPSGEPDDLDRDVHEDRFYQALRPLKRTVCDRWHEDASAGLVVVFHFVEMAEDLLSRSRIYQRTIDHRVPVEGSHRGVQRLLERCQEVTEIDDVELGDVGTEVRKALRALSQSNP